MAHEPIFFDIETTGFNPMAQSWYDSTDYDGRVTAIGMAKSPDWRGTDEPEDVTVDDKVLYDSSEYRLLGLAATRLQEWVNEIRSGGDTPFLVGFNSRQFDHPYIGARYSRLRIDGSLFTSDLQRLDMMRALGERWTEVGRYPSEDDCLEAVGIDSDDPFDGSDMPDFYGDGRWDDIATHVREDTKEMVKLFALTKKECMAEYYDHYDIEADPVFNREVDF